MKSVKVLIVFLMVMVISLFSISVYSQEGKDVTGVAEEMTEEEIEAEINEIVDEEIEVTEINIPEDTLKRLRLMQSNITKWQITMDAIADKYQIALGNLNLTKLEMKRLWQVRDAEFKLFLLSNDSCDIKYDEVRDWELRGNRAVKK